jgi:hypothetical protein
MQKPTHGYNPNPVVLPEAAKRAAEEEARARQTQVEVVATEEEAMQIQIEEAEAVERTEQERIAKKPFIPMKPSVNNDSKDTYNSFISGMCFVIVIFFIFKKLLTNK